MVRDGSREWWAAVLVAGLVLTGCGGGNGGAPAATPTASPTSTAPSPSPTSTVGPTVSPTPASAHITVVHSDLAGAQGARPVPPDVTRFRFTGYDAVGAALFGPEVVAKAVTVTLHDVPPDTVTLRIEYLTANDAVVGAFRTSVNLSNGSATIVNPSFVDTTDPVVFSFVSFGCNRVSSNALATNLPSSANIGQLTQDFAEIVEPSISSPTPAYVFFTGDLVLNLDSGTSTLTSQLQGWKQLYESTPLGMSAVQLVTIAGNHEMLVEITVTPTPKPTHTPKAGEFERAEGGGAKDSVKIEIPNPPTGAVFTSEMAAFIPAANGPTEAPPNLDHVQRDESMLSFSFQDGANVFILVNTDTYIGGDTPAVTGYVPLNWLQDQVSAANDNAAVENIFVFGHRPIDSPETSNLGITESQAVPFYEILTAPTTSGAPSKVRAYICAHAHLWQQGVPGNAPPGSTLPQVIAGNGGSELASEFQPPIYYGYSVFGLTQGGSVTLENWGRPVPTPYAAPPPQPVSTLREQFTLYAPPPAG
jgi:calcineurin-like phosphoesterase family protein